MHFFKFVRREDIERDIFQRVAEFEDFTFGRVPKNAGDVCMIAKRWLGDTEVLRLVALIPENTCAQLRTGAQEPTGLTERRGIGPKVVANINRYAPRCRKNGDINTTAFNYLTQWSAGTLQQVARPTSYPVLSYRWDPRLRAEPLRPGSWVTPRRLKHVDLTVEAEDGGQTSDSESDNQLVDLPA